MSLPPTLSSAPAGAASLPAAELRIVTYNVHSCIGTDRRLDPARIADVLASLEPDVVALQELDVGRRRTGGIDQAFAIAEAMKMASHFHPALLVREEKYGDAILTSLPSRLVKAGPLPSVGEPRGALWLEVMVGEQPVHIFNTHFGLRRTERIRQAEALTGPDWIGAAQQIGGPIVLAGDFNAIPSSPGYRRLAAALRPITQHDGRLLAPTFPSRFPLLRLDHLFVSEGVTVVSAAPVRTPLTGLASDHLPLQAQLRLTTGTIPAPGR